MWWFVWWCDGVTVDECYDDFEILIMWSCWNAINSWYSICGVLAYCDMPSRRWGKMLMLLFVLVLCVVVRPLEDDKAQQTWKRCRRMKFMMCSCLDDSMLSSIVDVDEWWCSHVMGLEWESVMVQLLIKNLCCWLQLLALRSLMSRYVIGGQSFQLIAARRGFLGCWGRTGVTLSTLVVIGSCWQR